MALSLISSATEYDWQSQLRDLIRSPKALIDTLELDPALLPAAEAASTLFPLRVTRAFVSRMRKNDPNDPLLKQVLPLGQELHSPEGYSNDPLKEQDYTRSRALIHKYHNRVLILGATSCAINCRYCFRREFDYADNRLSASDWQAALDYIEAHPAINEVIFSGGDPLLQNDAQWQKWIDALEQKPQLTRLRIHTRLPVVLPARVTDTLVTRLRASRLNAVVVVHCNHAQEIDAEVERALMRLRSNGVTVLNQAVLLRGVNDTLVAQVALSERLFEAGALPYYLHLLDRVNGAAHFDVPDAEAIALHNAMRGHLSGYLLPRLVREQAGDTGKTPVF